MEPLNDSRNISTEKKYVNAADTTYAPRTRHGTKLRDILMSDKPKMSYADFHHEITRNPDTLPKHVGSQQSQVLDRRTPKEDELVRYMSNLPSYLENGKNVPDKALNVGVLDWRRLEKWRYTQKQMPHKYSGYSPSSSNTSVFSTDGSSTHSSRGQSCSPARQRLQRLPLQSPLQASPKDGNVQDAKSSSGRGHSCSPARQRVHPSLLPSHPQKVYSGGGRPQDIEVFGSNTQKFQDSTNSSRQQKIFGAVQPCERKDISLKSVAEMGKRPTSDKYEVAAPWKGKPKTQSTESTKETRGFQETKLIAAGQGCSGREKSGVVIMPRDPSEHRCSGIVGSSSFTVNSRLSVEPCEKSILSRNNIEHPLPSKDDSCKHLEPSGSCSQHDGVKNSSQASHLSLRSTKVRHSQSRMSQQDVKGTSPASHMLSFPARMLSSPSRNRNTEEKPVAGVSSVTATMSPEELDIGKGSEPISKARNPSPIRRLSFAMGKIIKNAGSRDSSPLRRPSSKDFAKSGAHSASSSVPIDNPCSDKLSTNANNRVRSSPLRRLLDPLLKPRVSNSSEPSKKQSSSVVGTLKSCNEPLDFRCGHSVESHLRSATCSAVVSNSEFSSNSGPSSHQALLQLSFKNGLPLFTFATDDESNILAATVRKSSVPGKGYYSWTYTFFTIREVKRKSGIWSNHGGKGDGHGYVPNVVAQMKVSDSCSSSFTKHPNEDGHITREFDLFAVDVGHGDQYATDFHPTNELAAIVVKLPRFTTGDHKDDQSSFNWLDSSQASLNEDVQVMRAYVGSADSLLHHHSLVSLNLSPTVILPGGIHTVPSKGEISTLAQRWRSGGSCDCGGWDLGCQLRIYTNKKESNKGSSGICLSGDKFQLFSQVGQDNQPVLSLAPFKERIHSVEFNSSLSFLQAFAISVSCIDCRRPPELSEFNNIVEKVNNEVGVFEVPLRSKMSNQFEAPGRYVSYPPHSPVGRV